MHARTQRIVEMRRHTIPSKVVDGASCEESDTARTAVSVSFRFDTKIRKKPKNYNRVRFSSVCVREYDLCLGDNPSVARGAPISLDWTYRGSGSCFPLDDYEESQPSSSNNKRECVRGSSPSLKLTSLERLHILRNLGYSREEIKQATDEIQKNRRRRRLSTMRQVERAECIRSIARRFFRLFSRSDKPTVQPWVYQPYRALQRAVSLNGPGLSEAYTARTRLISQKNNTFPLKRTMPNEMHLTGGWP